MIYRLVTSKFTDRLAYSSASITALWDFIVRMYPAQLPPFMIGVSPLWGFVVSAFFGGLLICKYISIEGYALTLKEKEAEKKALELTIAKRDATVGALHDSIATLKDSEKTLQSRLDTLSLIHISEPTRPY